MNLNQCRYYITDLQELYIFYRKNINMYDLLDYSCIYPIKNEFSPLYTTKEGRELIQWVNKEIFSKIDTNLVPTDNVLIRIIGNRLFKLNISLEVTQQLIKNIIINWEKRKREWIIYSIDKNLLNLPF